MTFPSIRMYHDGDPITVAQIAATIDHSLLRPDITVQELKEGCALAREYSCISVCVRPSDLPIVTRELAGSSVLVTTVAAFPHGTATTESKIFETVDAVEKGAVEVDVVMNYARFLSGEFGYVQEELTRVAQAAHDRKARLKVIFENHYLTADQIAHACRIAETAGADFVKTSTGYAPSGSKIEDLKVMRASVSPHIMVKSAGGVKTLDQTLAVLSTGAVRVGTRSTRAILEEAAKREAKGTLIVKESI